MIDMSNVGLAGLKVLANQTGKILPKAKQLYAEHRAASGKPQGDTRLLRAKVSEVINRIIVNPKGAAWWKSAFQKLHHQIFPPPEVFEVIAVKEWLSDEGVQNSFGEIVSAILTGSSDDLSSRKRDLANKYSAHTGERDEYASYSIDIIVHTIIASILSLLDLSAQSVATFVQEEG